LIIRFKPSRSGFSLVELLLTLVLILCLAAAAVFSFTAVYRGANLDEGLDRMQALIRFAQAEAATTGRKVRLQFEPAALGAVPVGSKADETAESFQAGTEMRRIRVTWEPDYLTSPGVFESFTNKAWSEEMVNELVGIKQVTPLGAEASAAASHSGSANLPLGTEISTETADVETFGSEDFPAITFYPDGSSDSAEIVIASLNQDDQRRLAVRISGILGTVSSRALGSSDEEHLESDEISDQAAAEEFNELFESAAPVEEAPEF
jgi:type II secretion system protein H